MKSKEEVNLMSPLVWAYVGDSVYELYIREKLVNATNLKPHKLHIETIKYVKAKAQADTLEKIKEYLTQEELEIVRRTRNTQIIICLKMRIQQITCMLRHLKD